MIGARTLGVGIAVATIMAMTPLTMSSGESATDLVKVNSVCAGHGSCCGGAGTCELEEGFYIIDQQHPSWWERVVGCNEN